MNSARRVGVVLAVVWAATAWAQARVTSWDEQFDLPSFAWVTSSRHPRGASVEEARTFLLEFARLYGLSAAQIARADVAGVHDLHDGTAVIVTFTQRHEGVSVFRDEVKVVMSARGELIAIAGHLAPNVGALGGWRLTPQSAIVSAWQSLEGRGLEDDALRYQRSDERDAWWSIAGARELARVRAVWFAQPDGLVPAFRVELAGTERGLFSFIVSASDGSILFRHDLTATHSYLVFADPTTLEPLPGPRGSANVPSPGLNATPVAPGPPSLISLLHAGLSTGDPWLPPGATDTRGNNVVVSIDQAPPDGFNLPDEYVPVSAPGTFQWPVDLSRSPFLNAQQQRGGAVHLFYVTNYLHDVFYDDGFDERARNGQEQNFGRGGAPNDALLADSLDWSWSDNATMATPADGRSPRMTNFAWSGTPDRDGAFDTGIVAHEWGHFISNRLIGDGDGLDTLQAGGLGEGWGDFNASLLLATEADANDPWNAGWQGAYPLSTWVWDGTALHYGLRRWPLSSSFSHNPLTFRHISDGAPLPTSPPPSSWFLGPNAEVHNTGEVWAVMLWDCYSSLLADSRFTFTQARTRMRRSLVAGFKSTPLSPTFVDARDAMLAVAAANDPLDFVSFWNAFARRGLGFRAVAPARFGQHNSPLAEDFSVGAAAQLSEPVISEGAGACDTDGVLDVDEPGRARVRVRNLGTTVLSSVTITFSASAPSLTFPSGASVTLTNLPPFATVDAEVDVRLTGTGIQHLTLTATATAATIQTVSSDADFVFNTDVAPRSSATDDVEPPSTAWIASTTPSRDPGFTFSRRELTPSQHVWWAPSAASGFEFFLTSPLLDVGPSGLHVNFRHRYDFDTEANEYFDGATIELSGDDGGTWTDVAGALTPPYPAQISTQQGNSSNPLAGRAALVGQSTNHPAFNNASIDLTAWANRAVRLRFRVAGDDGLRRPSTGWELDDLQFVGLTSTPFPSLRVDPNRCSNQPPVADAGADFAVDEGQRIELSSGGFDPEGAPLTSRWSQLTGPSGVLQGNVFIAPEVDVDTPLTLRLVVNDGRADSAPDDVVLLVRNLNHPPSVSAPAGRSVQGGARVELTATARDADGDAVTLEWTQQSGPAVALEGRTTPTVAFIAPPANAAVQQVVLLVVARDATGASSPPAVVRVSIEAVATVDEAPMKPPPGCGCTSGPAVLVLVLLSFARRRRGERWPAPRV